MMNLLQNKTISAVLVIAVVAGLGYYVYSSSGGASVLLTAETELSPVSQSILLSLGQLRTLSLDPKLFKDPVFLSLTDFGVEIPPQAAGRRNPFAPVGADSARPAAATSSPATE